MTSEYDFTPTIAPEPDEKRISASVGVAPMIAALALSLVGSVFLNVTSSHAEESPPPVNLAAVTFTPTVATAAHRTPAKKPTRAHTVKPANRHSRYLTAREVAHRNVPAPKRATREKSLRVLRPAHSHKGIAPSLYRGKHYNPTFELIRRCIVKRESEGHYTEVYPDSTVSTASGAYQFIHPTSDAVARMMGRNDLVGIPASRWSHKAQDRAFWTLWRDGRGRSNWKGGRWRCW